MISKRSICSLVLVLTLTTSAFAQKPDATQLTEEQRKAQQELEHKALSLLDDVIKEGDAFKQAENRIQLKAASAYILWKHDEPRARSLFRDVTASLVGLLNNPEGAETPEVLKALEGAKMLRAQILQMLATCDARLAREFMRATRSQTDTEGNQMADADLQMDLNLAAQIAATDPKLALEIAEESFSKGFPYQLTTIVSALRAKDPDAAAKLASEIMTRLRSEKLAASSDARQMAFALLSLAAEAQESDGKGGTKNLTPLLEQSSVRELTEMVVAEALRGPGNEDLLMPLQQMMPIVEKYAPARVAQLKQKIPQAATATEEIVEPEDIREVVLEKYRPILEKGSANDLLAAAAKVPQNVQDIFYQRAAAKMIEDGDTEHARQIINEKVKDTSQREQMLEQVDRASAISAVEQGRIDQIRKTLATLRTNEERVMVLSQLAMSAGANGKKNVALKLLEEASGMINQRAKNINQLGAQLMVAHAYARLDPSRSFSILEPIVDQLNELLGAAAILGGFFVEELVRDDEIMLGPVLSFLSTASGEFAQYMGDLATLARADFERTRALVDKFQREEARVVMRLALAQSILSPPPDATEAVGPESTGPVVLKPAFESPAP